MDIKGIKGIAVVAINDGSRLGTINDVLFDLDNQRIRAFIVGSGGLFSSNDRILDMSDVKSIGTDAVMIESRDQLIADRNDTRYQAFPNVAKTTSLRVVSESGSLVGDLANVQFDQADGRLADIEVSPHGLLGTFRSNLIVPASAVVRFGQDVAVVPDKYAATASTSSEESAPDNAPNQLQSPPTG